MQSAQATITAAFTAQDCTLILREHSPNIEAPLERSLVDYLSFLSLEGWRITRASFEGFTIHLDLEKAAVSSPDRLVPIYLFHSFFISYFGLRSSLPPGPRTVPSGSRPTMRYLENAAQDQKALSKKFHDTIRADGWQELCTSRLLQTTGYWILSLWMRELPEG